MATENLLLSGILIYQSCRHPKGCIPIRAYIGPLKSKTKSECEAKAVSAIEQSNVCG